MLEHGGKESCPELNHLQPTFTTNINLPLTPPDKETIEEQQRLGGFMKNKQNIWNQTKYYQPHTEDAKTVWHPREPYGDSLSQILDLVQLLA